MGISIGHNQITILQTVRGGNWFHAISSQAYSSCMRLHQRGLLCRDRVNSRLFSSTPKGAEVLDRIARVA